MFPAALAIVVQTFALRERGRALAALLRHRRRADRRRPGPRRLPDRVDVAGHLLGEHPGGDHRPGPDRLARSRSRRTSRPAWTTGALVLIAAGDGAERLRFPAVVRSGAGATRLSGCASPRAGSPRRLLLRRDPHPVAADPGAASSASGRSWSRTSSSASPCWSSSRCSSSPASTPRSRSAIGLQGRPRTCCTSSSASSSPPRSAAGCSTGSGPSAGGPRLRRWPRSGFWLWAGKVTELSFSAQQWYIILAGAGMGFMLGPASTDAVNRASRLSYGEATGITQTVRNYAASLGLADPRHASWSPQMRSAGHDLADRPGRAHRPGRPEAGAASPSSTAAAAGAPRRSPTSSGSTSPTPAAPCST